MEIKSGKQTSEFVLALMPWVLALVVLIALAVGTIELEAALVLLAGLGIGGGYASGKYAESRGMVKAGAMLPLVEEFLPGAASHRPEAAE